MGENEDWGDLPTGTILPNNPSPESKTMVIYKMQVKPGKVKKVANNSPPPLF